MTFVAACELPRDLTISPSEPARVGGLSGLLYDAGSDTYLAIADEQRAPRMYRLRLAITGPSCTADVIETIPLRWADGSEPVRGARDFEDLTRLPGGDLLLVNEGDGARFVEAPGLHLFREDGRHVASLPVPDRVVPRRDSGARNNAAFESVAVTPDGRRVFTALEQPLKQDGDVATLARGAASRLIEYVPDGRGYAPGREFAVPVDPIPHTGDLVPDTGDIGIVALVALDASTLVMMERSFVLGTRDGVMASRNDILLSRLRLDRADDVAKVGSLRTSMVRPVEKERVLTLRDLASSLPPWLQRLDNFEGMTLGPVLTGGDRSLVLVSDDNFNELQRTAFVVLRMTGG